MQRSLSGAKNASIYLKVKCEPDRILLQPLKYHIHLTDSIKSKDVSFNFNWKFTDRPVYHCPHLS